MICLIVPSAANPRVLRLSRLDHHLSFSLFRGLTQFFFFFGPTSLLLVSAFRRYICSAVSVLAWTFAVELLLSMVQVLLCGVEALYQPTQKHKPLMQYRTHLCGLDFALGVCHPMFMILDKIINHKLSKR